MVLTLALDYRLVIPGVCGVYQGDGNEIITAKAPAQGNSYQLINLPERLARPNTSRLSNLPSDDVTDFQLVPALASACGYPKLPYDYDSVLKEEFLHHLEAAN